MKYKTQIVFIGGEDIKKKVELFEYISSELSVNYYIITGSNKKCKKEDVFFLSSNPFLFSKSVISLLKSLNKFPKDSSIIIHSFDTIPNLLVGIMGKYLPACWRIIRTINGLGRLFSLCDENISYFLMRKLYTSIISLTKKNFIFSIFQNKYDLSFYRKKNLVVPGTEVIIPSSGVNLEFFDPNKAFKPQFLNSKDNRTKGVISFIGRLLIEKGIQEFLDIAEMLKYKFNFLIAGGLDEKLPISIKNRLFFLSRKGIVKYLGDIKKEDVRNVLHVSDVLLFLSRYGEGTPRVVLESLAMGTPVICYDIPQMQSIIINRKTGFIVNNSDQVVKILNDKWSELQEIKAKKICRKYVLTHDVKNIARMHVSLYNEIMR